MDKRAVLKRTGRDLFRDTIQILKQRKTSG